LLGPSTKNAQLQQLIWHAVEVTTKHLSFQNDAHLVQRCTTPMMNTITMKAAVMVNSVKTATTVNKTFHLENINTSASISRTSVRLLLA
jgi:hypothetical protein